MNNPQRYYEFVVNKEGDSIKVDLKRVKRVAIEKPFSYKYYVLCVNRHAKCSYPETIRSLADMRIVAKEILYRARIYKMETEMKQKREAMQTAWRLGIPSIKAEGLPIYFKMEENVE